MTVIGLKTYTEYNVVVQKKKRKKETCLIIYTI